jgi:SAM-dependent methyltransferase
MEYDRKHLQTNDPFIAEDLRQLRFAGNYNTWLFSLLQPYLGKRILEIGPGIGNLTKHFIIDAEYIEGIEPNTYCADLLLNGFGANPKFSTQTIKVEDCDVEMLSKKNFNTVVCVNVLEHILHDLDTLVKFRQILAGDGNVVLLVPAVPWAYGLYDSAVGHYRRYTRHSMQLLLEKAGFELVLAKYSNMAGLIGWIFNSKIRKAEKLNDFQIRMFDQLVPILSRVERIFIPPFGLSIIAVGRKKPDIG